MMQKLTLLLVCLSVANGNPAAGKPWHWKSLMPVLDADGSFKPPSGRIVGGTEAVPHSWPHQVGLFIDGAHFCGGSLISNEWVMTAAHCADFASSIEVVMGAHNIREDEATQVTLTSTEFVVHEGWDYATLTNDIALIKLPQPVTFNENINSVQLPSTDVNVGDTVTPTGWGKISDDAGGISPTLNQVDNQVISNDDCAAVYGSTISDGILCTSSTGGHGTCNGDSGGPVNKDGKTYGISSFVADEGCESGLPDGFTRVFAFLDWIDEKTGVTPQ